MALLNTNMSTLVLPPDSATQLVIDEIWGDSQMGMNLTRLAGQWPTADLPFTGRLIGFLNTASTGVNLTLPDNSGFAGITHQTDASSNLYLRPGDAWSSDGNTSDHFNFSVGWDFASTGTSLRQLAILTIQESTHYTGSFPLANQRLRARVFYRNHAKCPPFRIYPHRNGSRGGATSVTPTGAGGIGVTDLFIGPTAPSSGAEPAGLEIWTDASYTAGDALEILGVLIYASDTGSTVNNGYVHVPIYKSGGNATSMASNVSDTALDALHTLLNDIRASGTKSVDLVQFEFGHNNDGAGYTTGLDTLRSKVAASLTRGSYDTPGWLFWAMWSYDGNATRMEDQANELSSFCVTNNYGFISLWETYNGVDPSTNGARFDGTAATYTMDGTNLHPADSATAKLIVQDIEEHWQPANFEPDPSAPTISNTTPADGATGVSDAATISHTFDQNMAAGTGTVQVLDWDTDTVILTKAAADVTINISDRTQVTLWAAGSLTGETGRLYVVAPEGYAASQSTGIDAPAITKGDWDFTIGSEAPTGTRSRVRRVIRSNSAIGRKIVR